MRCMRRDEEVVQHVRVGEQDVVGGQQLTACWFG